MAKIELVAIDVDGTCFKDHGDIIPSNIKPLIDVCKKGVKIALVTGRPFNKMLDDLKKNELEQYVHFIITYNGAHIYDVQKQIVINKSLIKAQTVAKVFEECKKWNVWLWIYSEDFKKIYTNFDAIGFSENDFLLSDSKIENKELTKTNTLQAYQLIIHKNPKVNNISNIHAVAYFCRTIGIKTFYVPHYAYMAVATDKGKSLELLAKTLKIKPEHIMAIGDGENDIPMFKYAGLAVVMKNAKPNIQTYANAITDTDLNGGVAKALEKYILK